MIRAYCTYFDARFLPRGLALHASLLRHAPESRLWIMALDEDCHRALAALRLKNVTLLRLSDLERADPELPSVRPTRSALEYALTCTPSLPRYVFDRMPEADLVTYLDADLYFFADPEPMFEELGSGTILITPHRYAAPFRGWTRFTGVYNDGWVTFRRGVTADACLARWREQCLEWCYNRSEAGRFTEQQYLDDWTDRYAGVVESTLPGANVGPWNLGTRRVRLSDDGVLIDERPLIFYHFSGIKRLAPGVYDLGTTDFRARPNRAAKRGIFAPYIRELRAISRVLETAALPTSGRVGALLATQPATLRLGRTLRSLVRGHCSVLVGNRLI